MITLSEINRLMPGEEMVEIKCGDAWRKCHSGV